ncbi:MAG: hypothetical protein FJ278_18535, partial [Planctomycetes bacterium]|nr:hypothetical protein [Planctomycetota bacterium]
MTSRERVLAALNHQEPDRVPIDLGGTFVTGIAAQALDRLRKRLGLEDRPVKVFDVLQMLGEVEMDVVERLQVDVLPVEPPAMTFGLPRGDWKPWRLFDGTDVLVPGKFHVTASPEGDWLLHPPSSPSASPIGRMPKDGFYFDGIDYGGWNPDFKPPSLEHLRTASKSWLVKDDLLRHLEGRARTLRQSTDKALALGAWGMASLHYVGKLTEFLCLLSSDRPYVHDLFALCAERAVENLGLLHQALGTNVDVIAA